MSHVQFEPLTKRQTILVNNTRSFGILSHVVNKHNMNLYKDIMFEADRVILKEKYDADWNLTHFELTGTSLDLFQIGMQYGHVEEREYLKSQSQLVREALLESK